jgi:predicted permease
LLIIAEIALAVVLVSGAGLLARSFGNLLRWSPGFEQAHLVTVWSYANVGQFDRAEQVVAMFTRAEQELRSIPSVVSVGSASAGPLFGGDGQMNFTIDGRAAPNDGPRQAAAWFDVSPTYFRTLGLPILQGRDISEEDRYGAPTVAVVNERFARTFLGSQPLGRRVYMVEHRQEFTVVGIVADVSPLRPGDDVEPQIYWSNRQVPRSATYFLVRTAGDPAPVARVIPQRLRAVNRDLQVSQVRTMREVLSGELVRPRFAAAVVSAFGVTALLLAAIGTYGLLAYAVQSQTKEIGIRLALGARPRAIIRRVLSRGMRLASLAAGLGVIGALMLTRLLGNQLAGVQPNDPLTLLVSVAVLLLVAAVASVVPAYRASRVDPIVTLRVD